jgi:hypothetical protein
MNVKSLIYHHSVTQSLPLDLFLKFRIMIRQNINNLTAIKFKCEITPIECIQGFGRKSRKKETVRKT